MWILKLQRVFVYVCRAEIEQLSLEKEHLQESAEKLRGRCEEMEEQCVQHGRMHQRMKQRYTHLQH